MVVPDPAVRAVFDQAGRADREAVCRASWRPCDPPCVSSPVRHVPDQDLGLADAELQLITGHARRETLPIYQHVCVDGAMADKYQAAMREAGL